MSKIQMRTPLVEMDGDEMTRIIWKMIKDHLLTPYIDLKTEYYDLGLPSRDETTDQITVQAAEAVQTYGVGLTRATRDGVQPQDYVQEPELHHPCDSRRYRVPYAHYAALPEALRAQLGEADHHCPSRLWRHLQVHRIPRSLRWLCGTALQGRGRQRALP